MEKAKCSVRVVPMAGKAKHASAKQSGKPFEYQAFVTFADVRSAYRALGQPFPPGTGQQEAPTDAPQGNLRICVGRRRVFEVQATLARVNEFTARVPFLPGKPRIHFIRR